MPEARPGERFVLYTNVFACGRFLLLRASWRNTDFVKTPQQLNLIPWFISSSSTFSPAWLMAMRFFTSITSSRPSSHVVLLRRRS